MDAPEQATVGLDADGIVSFGPFRLHTSERRIEKDGRPVALSGRPLDILIALAEQAGSVVSKQELMDRVWPGAAVDGSALRVHVAALRKALGDGEAGARYLVTVSGRGYCFVAETSRTDDRQLAPIAPPSGLTHNLPTKPGRMVGRDRAVRELAEQLSDDRFITIVGPGGIGKTTLAVATGRALLDAFAGAVCFLDLGTIQDPALVPAVVASTLGVLGRSRNPTDALAAFLSDKRMLLILDCCEHVIETSAALAERLYKAAPQLHILATSREALRVEGEHVHRLSPLTSPSDESDLTASQALAFPAIQLFVERASASNDRFRLNESNAPLVGEICRRLDGVPLAIELVSSAAGTYGVEEMLALLSDKFRLLWEGRRTAPPRHRTLRAMLDWSYDLLSELERAVLCRLSVFAGTFTLEAACRVATADDISEAKAVEAIHQLVAKSIVSVGTAGESPRYRLLDITSSYAAEKRAARPDADLTARRHASYFLNLLERMGENPGASAASRSFSSIADQFGNIRSALAWCFSERGDGATGVALAAASMPLFLELSLFGECRLWARRAINHLDGADGDIGHALNLHAALGLAVMFTGGSPADAGTSFTTALRLAEQIGDTRSQLRVIERLHMFLILSGNFVGALELAKRGEAIVSGMADPFRLAPIQVLLGISHHLAGDTATARSYVEAALPFLPATEPAVHDPLDFDYGGRARIALARILWLQGYPDQALDIARRALDEAIRVGNPAKFARTLFWAFPIFCWNMETEKCEEYVERLVLESRRYLLGFYQTIGEGAQGAVLVARGKTEAGIVLMRRAQETMRRDRSGPATYFSIPLAEALAMMGQQEEALQTIDRAIASARLQRNLCTEPGMLCTKADVSTAAGDGDVAQAESCLGEALDLARQQSALSWELRSATGLARLWLRQGRHDEARRLLAPIRARFTEGFGSRALMAADQLLGMLNSRRAG